MRKRTNVAVSRLVGALIGTLLLATTLAAPTTAAATSKTAAAPLLARGAGYELSRGSARVHALQLRLRAAGESPGPVDGYFGPLTEAAVRHFQAREGLAVDGLVGPQTQAALRREAALLRLGTGYRPTRGSRQVRKLQRDLRSAGEHPGRIDGRFGPVTEHAVRHFQHREGLAVDGVVGGATSAALAKRLASVRDSRANRHPGQAKDRPKAAGPSGQPKTTVPTGPPKTAAVGNRRANDSGGSTTMMVALSVGAALALLLGIFMRTLRRRSRETAVSVDPWPPAGGKRADAGPDREVVSARESRDDHSASVLGYACVDAPPGAAFNGEFVAQAEKIASECEKRGLVLLELVREREPDHRSGLKRPGLGYALDRISAGEADGLVVAELSRLSTSATELGKVLDWLSRSNVRLVVAESGLDTTERDGRLAARMLIEVSGWERERLIERTRKGMTAARRKGPPGVADNPELKRRIQLMRATGMTLQAIADRLNAEGVPTVRGGAKWRPSSVQAAAGYRRPRSDNGPRTKLTSNSGNETNGGL